MIRGKREEGREEIKGREDDDDDQVEDEEEPFVDGSLSSLFIVFISSWIPFEEGLTLHLFWHHV